MAAVLPQPQQMLTLDQITPNSIFQVIRHINDPEHPKTLEQLDVVQEQLITCDMTRNYVNITFTPTIPHCSMATLIGLCIRVKLERALPRAVKFDIAITKGTHSQEEQVTKQLRDKERVHAALENPSLMSLVEKCIEVSEINNPVFFNPNASCGNSTGLKPDEQPQHSHGDGECCGGHGHGDNNNDGHDNKDGCCGGSGKKDSNDECCKDKDTNTTKNEDKPEDECCGGNGEGDSCCQSK